MPFTPFHFGPGAAFKAVMPRYFSFTIFVFTQVVTDLETLYFLLKGDSPFHRFFHTYLGATVVGVIVIVIGKPLCEWALRLWNGLQSEELKRWFYIGPRISILSAVTSAFLGSYSHVMLDSIRHSDTRPFAPFSNSNGLLRIITLPQLHMLCIALGVVGILVLLGYFIVQKAKALK